MSNKTLFLIVAVSLAAIALALIAGTSSAERVAGWTWDSRIVA